MQPYPYPYYQQPRNNNTFIIIIILLFFGGVYFYIQRTSDDENSTKTILLNKISEIAKKTEIVNANKKEEEDDDEDEEDDEEDDETPIETTESPTEVPTEAPTEAPSETSIDNVYYLHYAGFNKYNNDNGAGGIGMSEQSDFNSAKLNCSFECNENEDCVGWEWHNTLNKCFFKSNESKPIQIHGDGPTNHFFIKSTNDIPDMRSEGYDVLPNHSIGGGDYNTQASIPTIQKAMDLCKPLCDNDTDCIGFQWRKSDNSCGLKNASAASLSEYGDHIFFSKKPLQGYTRMHKKDRAGGDIETIEIEPNNEADGRVKCSLACNSNQDCIGFNVNIGGGSTCRLKNSNAGNYYNNNNTAFYYKDINVIQQ